MNEIYNCNKTIEKNASAGIKIAANVDFTDWTLIYLAKQNMTDADANAVISITPVVITEDDTKKILVSFTPSATSTVAVGTYFHALKVIAPNEETAMTLFKGQLTIEQNYINAPEGE